MYLCTHIYNNNKLYNCQYWYYFDCKNSNFCKILTKLDSYFFLFAESTEDSSDLGDDAIAERIFGEAVENNLYLWTMFFNLIFTVGE